MTRRPGTRTYIHTTAEQQRSSGQARQSGAPRCLRLEGQHADGSGRRGRGGEGRKPGNAGSLCSPTDDRRPSAMPSPWAWRCVLASPLRVCVWPSGPRSSPPAKHPSAPPMSAAPASRKRIRYIDLACCTNLTDNSVTQLATLPKLKRIGLVKCGNITDRSILALAKPKQVGHGGPVTPSVLERVHLSYCTNLTLNVRSSNAHVVQGC